MLIPSDATPHARAALERLIVDGSLVQIAAAFVTSSGVEVLAELLEGRSGVTLSVVARAADATEPEALLMLRDRLGAEVRVVIGDGAQRFHPKLWLIHAPQALHVLSGSGNLTRGGLVGNDEQFEHLVVETDDPLALEQAVRFDRLTGAARGLGAAMRHPAWATWLRIRERTAALRAELQAAEAELEALELAPEAVSAADRAVAVRFGTTVNSVLVKPSGKPMLHRRDCWHPPTDARWRYATPAEMAQLQRCNHCDKKDAALGGQPGPGLALPVAAAVTVTRVQAEAALVEALETWARNCAEFGVTTSDGRRYFPSYRMRDVRQLAAEGRLLDDVNRFYATEWKQKSAGGDIDRMQDLAASGSPLYEDVLADANGSWASYISDAARAAMQQAGDNIRDHVTQAEARQQELRKKYLP